MSALLLFEDCPDPGLQENGNRIVHDSFHKMRLNKQI